MSEEEIVWEDPPPARRGGKPSAWIPTLAKLIDHPNRWAKVRTYKKTTVARSVVSQLRNGRHKLPPGRWEFVAHGTYVYARYLGPAE